MKQRALSCTTVMFSSIVLFASFALAQQRESSVKKPAEQSATPTSPQAAENAKQDKNEGDPLFKGMKYRAIGPFRGGRSLTASGIAGDPTTYYFGATGGGLGGHGSAGL